MLDYIRIACAVPPVKVGDTVKNAEDICRYMEKADEAGADLVLFPEMALTGYTCQDLVFQETLHEGIKGGLRRIVERSKAHPGLTAVVGLPVRVGARMYNAAAIVADGCVHLTAKTYLSAGEKRWFNSVSDLSEWGEMVHLRDLGLDDSCQMEIPLAKDLVFTLPEGTRLGVEIGDDLWSPLPPSTRLALGGAEVIVNLSASNELAGRRTRRREAVKHQSAALNCVYAYCSAGSTESTQDLVYSGQSIVAENGAVLAETETAVATDYMLVADCDLGRVRANRRRNRIFTETATAEKPGFRPYEAWFPNDTKSRSDGSLYPVRKLPFIPSVKEERQARCREIFQLQVTGLKQRLTCIGNANAVIGISGGLDSTLALLVAVEAMRQMGRPASDVYGVTMPCFGTSDRTYNNAWELMRKLGISCKEINIRKAVSQHFEDIGHDISVHNATYENAQARERTQILMDYASIVGGIVVGTGDLSELALGWCTYNGDHMSMYGVNGTVPKTLIRWIIETVADDPAFAASKEVLMDVLDTPISPELLPPDAEGKISQQTEDLVGPYALHDFFLYYVLRFGFTPEKIYTLACRAFKDDFDAATIKKWLKNFYRRFFTQQFKRSCMPDGVKVGSVGLGPRGDWLMPSDATARIWLNEVEKL